jgi:lysophospholipase L1-like esterase
VLVNLAVFAGLLLVVEGGAWLLAPRDLRGVFGDPQTFLRARPFVQPHAERGFALRPGYAGGEIHINSAGLRGPELPADLAQHPVVLAVGESSTFGWMVGDDDTYPAHLQHVLGRLQRPPFVLNAGVPSYTSPQVRAYLRELLPRYRPKVVLASLLWNDALFACVPHWMPDYLVKQQPVGWRRFLLRHSGLYRACAIRAEPAGRVDFVHNERALRFYADNLAAMARDCRAHGAQLVFVRPSMDPAHIPAAGMKIGPRLLPRAAFAALLRAFAARLEQAAAREHVPLFDHRFDEGDPALSGFFLDPVHLNEDGNEMLAEEIAAYLTESVFPAEPLASDGKHP